MAKENKVIPINKKEQLAQEIEAEKKERSSRVSVKINEILKSENCVISIKAIFEEGKAPEFVKTVIAH